MQEYELSRQTHKMTIVLRLKVYKILLDTAGIAYENTYDMREYLQLLTPILKPSHVNVSDLVVQKYSGIGIQSKTRKQNC